MYGDDDDGWTTIASNDDGTRDDASRNYYLYIYIPVPVILVIHIYILVLLRRRVTVLIITSFDTVHKYVYNTVASLSHPSTTTWPDTVYKDG